MSSMMGRCVLLSVAILATGAASARAADPENCLLCHQYRGLARFDENAGRVHAFFVDPEYHRLLLGAHAQLACTDCHVRGEVSVIPHQPATKVDCTKTCHLADALGAERRFSHANIAEILAGSVHRPDVMNGLDFRKGPLLDPGQSSCLYCHDEPLFRDPAGVIPKLAGLGSLAMKRCDHCHRTQLPVDTDYYLRHIASRLQPARANLEVAQVCAVCHSDSVVLEKCGLPDSVASYLRSFHGKAALLGAETTAGCVSCHAAGESDVHLMLSRTDARSPVHPSKLAGTCSTIECHPGAVVAFGEASVHLDLPSSQGAIEYVVAALFIVLTVLTFGPSALFALLSMVQVVAGRRERGGAQVHALTERILRDPRGPARLSRFTPVQRVQHWLLAILFTLLAVTGFPLKFADTAWARSVVGAFGGLGSTRVIHHWAGIVLVLGLIGHLIYAGVIIWRRAALSGRGRGPRGLIRSLFSSPIWIGMVDVREMMQTLQFFLFLRPDRPLQGRFSLKEKFEYIGVFWGTVLLGVTGILLWGEQAASYILSGRILNLCAIAHTYEAFLAIIHVGILHTYNVMLSPHVFPLSPATITGRTPVAELAEEHGRFVQDAAGELGIE